jgi:hypothetical protein
MGLALRVGDGDQIRRVVDDDRVVDVVVDDVGWRRCDLRRCYPYRDGPIFRDREHERDDRRRRRWQVNEINRRRRKENDRRWRRWFKAELGIIEHEERPLDIDDFIGRWRRQAIINDDESGRRFQRSRKIGQTPPAIIGMGTTRITFQI